MGGGFLVGVGIPAARSDTPDSEIRFPVFEGSSISNDRGERSSPPEIPFSIVDEVPGRSPGAVSGSWIAIFEIDLDPIGTGTLDDAEASPGDLASPDESARF